MRFTCCAALSEAWNGTGCTRRSVYTMSAVAGAVRLTEGCLGSEQKGGGAGRERATGVMCRCISKDYGKPYFF